MSALLDKTNSSNDIKKLDFESLCKLAGEIRKFLLERVSVTGGHLASNLGVVELTLAIHKEFDTQVDKVVWDVGHQTYVHKILTGRRDCFDTLRQKGGISGFPKTSECIDDCFNTGHSSTSISAALGLARARDLKNEKHYVLSVIGDGALTGGMAFEAMNDAGRSYKNFIVILNDNEMSIARNVGSLSKYLNKIRTEPVYFKAKKDLDNLLRRIPAIGKSAVNVLKAAKGRVKYAILPGMIFEELGFHYLGPVDGHNIQDICEELRRAKKMNCPVLIHVCTKKGKGYSFAEEKPHDFHGISPFEIETGEIKVCNGKSWSDVFGETLVKAAEKDNKICAVTAAMPHGTGLHEFSGRFSERFFDVGIAEQHAVTMSAGLAAGGMKPVFAVYSSFLQRAYDQILHDVVLQRLHVVFAIDRAGVVGEDGETHQGIYDLSYLSHMPGMTILAPSDYEELRLMLLYALNDFDGPIAVRYPRGCGIEKLEISMNEELRELKEKISFGKGIRLIEGSDVTIACVGSITKNAAEASTLLCRQGIYAEVLDMRFVKPVDRELLCKSLKKTGRLVTIEDNAISGGFGSMALQTVNSCGLDYEAELLGFPDKIIPHANRNQLFENYGLDAASICERVKSFLVYRNL